MDKELWVLGLLRDHSLHGYELHRIVRSHGALYRELKKANLYHLLDRLAGVGYLTVETEPGTRGARGERLVYTVTAKGRARFYELLRQAVRTYEPASSGVAAAIPFLVDLPPAETMALLAQRRAEAAAYQQQVLEALGESPAANRLTQIAADHILAMIAAELGWIDRSLDQLKGAGADSRHPVHRSAEETQP